MAIAFNKIKNRYGLDDTLPFGSYQGYTVSEIIKDQPEYISWLMTNTSTKFYDSVHQELSKCVFRIPRSSKYNQSRYNRIYYGDLRGDLAHETMTQIQQAIDDESEWMDDIPF